MLILVKVCKSTRAQTRPAQFSKVKPFPGLVQNRTALANTPGSLFFKECEEAFAKGDFLTILNRFVEQADVLFTKITDKGKRLPLQVHVGESSLASVSTCFWQAPEVRHMVAKADWV